MFFDDEEYQKYLDNITELASNSEEFSVEIKRVNGIIKGVLYENSKY